MLFTSAVVLDLQGCVLIKTRVELHHKTMKWTRQAYLNTHRLVSEAGEQNRF